LDKKKGKEKREKWRWTGSEGARTIEEVYVSRRAFVRGKGRGEKEERGKRLNRRSRYFSIV